MKMPSLSPRQAALAVGVSESSVKRWLDSGAMPCLRTPGGHRRIPRDGFLQWVRESGRELQQPAIVGLQAGRHASNERLPPLRKTALDLLLTQHGRGLDSFLVALHAEGHPVTALCDDLLAPVMAAIGEGWSTGDVSVAQERAACEAVLAGIAALDGSQPTAENAPIALGATLSHDHYAIPLRMGRAVLRSAGYNAILLGNHLPVDTLTGTVRHETPKLLWLSVTHLTETPTLREDLQALADACRDVGTGLVVGGACAAQARPLLEGAIFGGSMVDLDRIAREHWHE